MVNGFLPVVSLSVVCCISFFCSLNMLHLLKIFHQRDTSLQLLKQKNCVREIIHLVKEEKERDDLEKDREPSSSPGFRTRWTLLQYLSSCHPHWYQGPPALSWVSSCRRQHAHTHRHIGTFHTARPILGHITRFLAFTVRHDLTLKLHGNWEMEKHQQFQRFTNANV